MPQSVESVRCTELFFTCLYLHLLFDTSKFQQGQQVSTHLVRLIQAANIRALDILAAKVYHLYSRFFEIDIALYRGLLSHFLNAFRIATVRGDLECQAELANVILRYYIQFNLFDSADKFITKIQFPTSAQNNHLAKFMYYLGRVSAVHLDYSEAAKYLQHAIRKAPQGLGAAGFLQAANKLYVLVQLLMGDIPEKSLFSQAILKNPLEPYFELTQAVRSGDLTRFQHILVKHELVFQKDKTWTLVLRLRHNVIRTGIRLIGRAYSRISFLDISTKLRLESEQDAEFIVAKSIRDGTIEGKIDPLEKCLVMKHVKDVYRTAEPESAFEHRTRFCLALYDEALKAMRYPEDLQSKKDWRSSRRHQLKDFLKPAAHNGGSNDTNGKEPTPENSDVPSDLSFDEADEDLDF